MNGSDTVLLPPTATTTGFYAHDSGGHNGHYGGHHHNHGISGKDASFISGQNNQNATSDAAHSAHMDFGFLQANTDRFGYALLNAIETNGRDNMVATEKVGAANQLATEKTAAAVNLAVEKVGAAGQLATEKIGAAINLTIEKTAAATNLTVEKTSAAIQLEALRNRSDVLAAIAACCCELKEGQAATNALILSVDANRVRDDLNQARQELLLLKVGGGNPGNSVR